jgi:hypothetical protein
METKKLSFSEKNNFVVTHSSAKYFDKDLELESQRNLFKECFPENDGTLVEESEHYLWKFHSFPAQPTSYEYGAYMENDLVGYYAAIPYEYKINNATIKVGMVCDVMTGVKARGKGVFTKMGIYSTAEMKNEGLEFTIGYPIRPEVIPGHIKAGWEKLFPLPLYMNFLSSKSLLKDKSININNEECRFESEFKVENLLYVKKETFTSASKKEHPVARELLKKLGVKDVELEDEIDDMLRNYDNGNYVPLKEHIEHLKHFITYYDMCPENIEIFKDVLNVNLPNQ